MDKQKFFIINVRESSQRRREAIDALRKHGVTKFEFIHPLMVRDFKTQDAFFQATGMTAFKKLKGSPPLVATSFLHTYIRCLTRIEEYPDTETIGIIIEDDCHINRDITEIKRYIETLQKHTTTNFFFAQLANWRFDDEPEINSTRIDGTPFVRGAQNGTWANALNKTAAATLKTTLLREIPIRFSQHHVFGLDIYLKEFATYFKDFFTVTPETDLFIHTSAPTEYLRYPDGELTVRNAYEAKK